MGITYSQFVLIVKDLCGLLDKIIQVNSEQETIQISMFLLVHSVSCGRYHTLIITTDSCLCSCGNNDHGQLCLGNKIQQLKPQKTSFLNISKISKQQRRNIFACGHNSEGECGSGYFRHPQVTPSLNPDASSNIIQFVCGYHQSLFLDSGENVFSVGHNRYGLPWSCSQYKSECIE